MEGVLSVIRISGQTFKVTVALNFFWDLQNRTVSPNCPKSIYLKIDQPRGRQSVPPRDPECKVAHLPTDTPCTPLRLPWVCCSVMPVRRHINPSSNDWSYRSQ